MLLSQPSVHPLPPRHSLTFTFAHHTFSFFYTVTAIRHTRYLHAPVPSRKPSDYLTTWNAWPREGPLPLHCELVSCQLVPVAPALPKSVKWMK